MGKGTQAELLHERLGACHLSTGDVFRSAKTLCPCDRSPALEAALELMKNGKMVSDTTVLDVVIERSGCFRCQGGFVLDGFPRTVAQAEALEQILAVQNIRLDLALSYELPIEQIVSRLSGRRTCSRCKKLYHLEHQPPSKPGLCDQCCMPLFQREDDRPEVVRTRMQVYEEHAAPLREFYEQKYLLASISADGTPEDIFQRTLVALKDRISSGKTARKD